MTIDKKLDALLDHCGITPCKWLVSKCSDYCGSESCDIHWLNNGVFHQGSGFTANDARLISKSRENIKLLIKEAFFHMDYERYMGGQDKDFDLDNNQLGFECFYRIETSLPMTWEEIKKWLEDCDG
jgi:hypothetical protein